MSLLGAGCGGPAYEIATVRGVLKINGKPGHKVMLQFIPEAKPGEYPPSSVAETDSDGRFEMRLFERGGKTPQLGAVVGSHRVVLNDLQLAESETGRGVPVRFDSSYTMVGSTPLRQEIVPGDQTIEISTP